MTVCFGSFGANCEGKEEEGECIGARRLFCTCSLHDCTFTHTFV